MLSDVNISHNLIKSFNGYSTLTNPISSIYAKDCCCWGLDGGVGGGVSNAEWNGVIDGRTTCFGLPPRAKNRFDAEPTTRFLLICFGVQQQQQQR